MQHGIYYTPNIEFYAFDIAITIKHNPKKCICFERESNEAIACLKFKAHLPKGDVEILEKIEKKNNNLRREYMNYEDSLILFEYLGFFYAKPLFIGPLEKCLHFNHEFKSTIPKVIASPPLFPLFYEREKNQASS